MKHPFAPQETPKATIFSLRQGKTYIVTFGTILVSPSKVPGSKALITEVEFDLDSLEQIRPVKEGA